MFPSFFQQLFSAFFPPAFKVEQGGWNSFDLPFQGHNRHSFFLQSPDDFNTFIRWRFPEQSVQLFIDDFTVDYVRIQASECQKMDCGGKINQLLKHLSENRCQIFVKMDSHAIPHQNSDHGEFPGPVGNAQTRIGKRTDPAFADDESFACQFLHCPADGCMADIKLLRQLQNRRNLNRFPVCLVNQVDYIAPDFHIFCNCGIRHFLLEVDICRVIVLFVYIIQYFVEFVNREKQKNEKNKIPPLLMKGNFREQPDGSRNFGRC